MGELAEEKIESMIEGTYRVRDMSPSKIDYKDVKRYRAINSELSKLEKEKKALNEKFKKALGNSKTNYQINDLVVKIIPQDKSKLDEEAAIKYLRQKAADKVDELVESGMELEEAEATVETIFKGVIFSVDKLDSALLENLALQGVIDAVEFSKTCVIPNTVITLRIDPYVEEEALEE